MLKHDTEIRKKYVRKEFHAVRTTNLRAALSAAIFACMMLTGCVKDTLYNTPHPDRAAFIVNLPGVSLDDDYVLDMDGKTTAITGSPFTYPDLLAPGEHSMLIYNRAEGFTFDGRIARVNPIGDMSRTATATTAIIAMPGHLYAQKEDITAMPDDTVRVNINMSQAVVVRDLEVAFEVTQGRPDLIHKVTASLGGIAGALDMDKGVTVGDPVSTVLAFTREGSNLTADARLLGTMGSAQTLTIEILFADGGRIQRTEVDLTEAMKGFNGDMTTTYRVTGTLETPVSGDISATIVDWTSGNESGDDVELE